MYAFLNYLLSESWLSCLGKAVYPNLEITEQLFSLPFTDISITDSYYVNGLWSSICWSEELNIFVAVANVNNSFPLLNKITGNIMIQINR